MTWSVAIACGCNRSLVDPPPPLGTLFASFSPALIRIAVLFTLVPPSLEANHYRKHLLRRIIDLTAPCNPQFSDPPYHCRMMVSFGVSEWICRLWQRLPSLGRGNLIPDSGVIFTVRTTRAVPCFFFYFSHNSMARELYYHCEMGTRRTYIQRTTTIFGVWSLASFQFILGIWGVRRL